MEEDEEEEEEEEEGEGCGGGERWGGVRARAAKGDGGENCG